ncbi:MAG: arginine--tRNA ligase [Proteobacteria bacterium]|nr:arginine--tRNA ligase [Pseudomonadota bacterium]
MNYFHTLRERIRVELALLAEAGALPKGLEFGGIAVDPPRESNHGDVATNAALVLAKPAGMAPQKIAALLAEPMGAHADTERAEVAGPGFLNLTFRDSFWHKRLAEALAARDDFGRIRDGGGGRVNVEYVSANPTGPMHVGHARGAVFGDALASVLTFAGADVTSEFFINDAGAQVEALARSTHLRYRQALGHEIGEIPAGMYPGDYLVPVGQQLAATYGKTYENAPEAEWRDAFGDAAVAAMMREIRGDLDALGVRHDVFTSESELVAAGKVDDTLSTLRGKGLIYEGVLEPPKGKEPEDWEPREQTLFRSTDFGDDIDRPVRKSDGSWTYFATDTAYHADKIARGFDTLINVWGADHGGYIKRMRAVVEALSGGEVALDVQLCQLVRLMRRGQPVKMSKRAGEFVTLRDVTDEVGKDVVRFIMLTRRNDAPLDFDFATVTEQSRDNPVFYVQYAHARCRSVLRNAATELPALDLSPAALADADLGCLTHPDEIALIKSLAGWPRVVEAAAEAHEPHRIAFYLRELAACFHTLWTRGKEDATLRFLIPGDEARTAARLALVSGCASGLAVGLRIIGVTPAEELR